MSHLVEMIKKQLNRLNKMKYRCLEAKCDVTVVNLDYIIRGVLMFSLERINNL